MEVHGSRKVLLLIVPLLVGGMIAACDLGGLLGRGEAVPDVVINAPPNNAEVRLGEAIPIRSTATDDTGVTRIELWVDNAPYTAEISPVAKGQSPFSVAQSWTPQALGSHIILVRAYNAAGNMGESASIRLIVVGGPPGPQPTEPGPQPTQPGPPPTQPPPQPTQPGPPPTHTPTQPPPTHTPTPPPPSPTDTPPPGPCLPAIIDTISLAGHPKGVTVHGHRVYVGIHDQPLVQVIDADTNTVLPSLNTQVTAGPGYANGVAFHNGRVYVANRDDDSVSSINVGNPSDTNVIPTTVGGLPFGVAVAGQYVYVANFGSNRIGRIDTSTDAYSSLMDVFNRPALLGALGQDVFVPTNGPGPIYRVPPSGSPIAIGLAKKGYFAATVNTISGRVFVTDRDGGNVLKIDANTNLVEATVHIPVHRPYGIAVNSSKGRIYVIAAEADLLYVLDAPTLQIVGSVPVGGQGAADGGQGIALWGDKIYVSNYQDSSVTVLDDTACP